MSKREGRTVYEDKAAKEEARKKRHQENLARHTVNCPHCNEPVLDHLEKCPHCGGELVPKGYRPMNPKTLKIIKIVLYTVGFGVAIVLIALRFFA